MIIKLRQLHLISQGHCWIVLINLTVRLSLQQAIAPEMNLQEKKEDVS